MTTKKWLTGGASGGARLLEICRKKPFVAFSSAKLPEVNIGKLLKGLGLGTTLPLAVLILALGLVFSDPGRGREPKVF